MSSNDISFIPFVISNMLVNIVIKVLSKDSFFSSVEKVLATKLNNIINPKIKIKVLNEASIPLVNSSKKDILFVALDLFFLLKLFKFTASYCIILLYLFEIIIPTIIDVI